MPKTYENAKSKPEAEERRRTFVLDARGIKYGDNLFRG